MANVTPIAQTIALNEFLHRFLDDRERGALASVDAYAALFPAAGAVLRDEYARLVGATGAPRADGVPDGAPAGGAVDGSGDGGLGAGRRLGPYSLVRRLGQGAFGLVYLAEDTRLGRPVALKLLGRGQFASGRERAMFQREAEVAARLEHPGICGIHEIGQHGIWTWIAMRYVPGESLAERIARERGSPSPPDAAARRARALHVVACVEKIARALAVAHDAGIVHRDIKPANVMLGADDEPVILDFGLARDVGPDARTLTASGDVLGTPVYMSPEQVAGDRQAVDGRTDVWSLGVLLYEWLTLRRPFDGHSEAEVFRAIAEREPASVRQLDRAVPKDLAVVVATALAKDRVRRYQSAADFADDLLAVRRGEPVRARPIGAFGRVARWVRRRPVTAGLVAAIVVAIAAGSTASGVLLLRARRHLADWERLADGRRLEDLLRIDEEELWPVVPERAPAMRAWLVDARALAARLADHRRALAELRVRSRPYDEVARQRDRQRHGRALQELAAIDDTTARYRAFLAADSEARARMRIRATEEQAEQVLADMAARRVHFETEAATRLSWEFDDAGDQLRHDRLAELVDRLARLAGEVPGAMAATQTTIASMEQRLAFAETLRQRTIDAFADAWQQAALRVAANPRYCGLRLIAQVGLVPLGPDPASTFEEFGELVSGELAVRDAAGRIVPDERSGMVFVLLPGGPFVMGAQCDDPAAANYDAAAVANESPPRAIELAPFFVAKFEMTQGQWQRVAGENPSRNEPGRHDGEHVADLRYPVETVSWHDCVRTLRHMDAELPTEAQWEYACRAGTDTPFWCAAEQLAVAANVADRRYRSSTNPVPFDDWDDGRANSAPVGSYRANAFGLFDVIGNVFEWCRDSYGNYEREPRAGDGLRVFPGFEQVLRGGSFTVPSASGRSAVRFHSDPTLRHYGIGVRAARGFVAG